MKITTVKYPKTEQDEIHINEFVDQYQKLLEKKSMKDASIIELPVKPELLIAAQKARAGPCTQLKWLSYRAWILTKRERRLSTGRIIQITVVAIFTALTFQQLG